MCIIHSQDMKYSGGLSNHLISLCNAHFHWSKCALPGKVIPASPYSEVLTCLLSNVDSNVISNANVKEKISISDRRNKMIRNRCNIFWVDKGIHTKNRGKTYASLAAHMMQFSLRFWSEYLHQPEKYYNDSLKPLPCYI